MSRNKKRARSQGPVRYALYQRCSTDDQRHGDFTTIDVQQEVNARHVREKGGEVVAIFSDEGKSGTNLNRPGWKNLLAAAREGGFDRVCVTYTNRLGRGESATIAE
jgi:site-specific DNA recombinase